MIASQELDAAFAALADPTRRAILARLAEGEATVLTLAETFEISLPAISTRLKVLEQAGLITRSRDAQCRPCRLHVESWAEVPSWIEHTRRTREARFSRLESCLEQLQIRSPAPAEEKADPGC